MKKAPKAKPLAKKMLKHIATDGKEFKEGLSEVKELSKGFKGQLKDDKKISKTLKKIAKK